MARIVASNSVPGSRSTRSAVQPPVFMQTGPSRPVEPARGVPVLMSDQVTVPAGGEQPFSSQAYLNNRGVPVLVSAMNVFTSSVPTVLGTLMMNGTIAIQAAIKRRGGAYVPLTRGYVPVWSLARSQDRLADFFAASLAGEASAMTWRFPHPLQLDPGDMIETQVKHLGMINLPITVSVSYSGADGSSPVRRIPYAVGWQSTDFDYAQAGTDMSPTDALMNDLNRDFIVDRIIGRFASSEFIYTAPGELPQMLTALTYGDFGDVTNQGTISALIRLSLSQQRAILRDFTPFRSVFGQAASIESPFVLAPKDYLIAEIQHYAGVTMAAATLTSSVGRAFVSLVGWREG